MHPAISAAAARYRTIPVGDLMANWSLQQDAPITALIAGEARPAGPLLGELLFRQVVTPLPNFKYRVFGLEEYVRKDARRHLRAPFQTSDFRVDMRTGSMQRFGWAAMADRDELRVADLAEGFTGLPLGIRAKFQRLSRKLTELDLEYERAQVALAAASYSSASPDLDTTIAGGSEWNDSTNGDARTSIRAMAATLAARHAATTGHVDVYLTHKSFEAAQDDPTFYSLRTGSANPNATLPSAAELAAYWGVHDVIVADSYLTTDGDTLTSMYGDVAILKIAQPMANFDESEGQQDSFVRFNWSAFVGTAAQPWFDNMHTSWYFPYEAWEQAVTVNTAAAAIIRNTSNT